MILSHNKSLYDKLFVQIARMHDEVDYRKHLNAYIGQSGKWKDFPAVSVGAEYDMWSAIGHHHSRSQNRDFHPLLLRSLTDRLGELNDDSKHYHSCRNKVGHCAENYAASGVINALDPNGNLNDTQVLRSLRFTKAFRPRTWQNIEWCANCHTMFD